MALPWDPINLEFVLSFEDWLEARGYRPRNEKERTALRADYLRFSAEQRIFHADADGWTYSSSAAEEEQIVERSDGHDHTGQRDRFDYRAGALCTASFRVSCG